jgi:hypothetical protein
MFLMNVVCCLLILKFFLKSELKSAKIELFYFCVLKLITKIGCLLLLCWSFGVVGGSCMFVVVYVS